MGKVKLLVYSSYLGNGGAEKHTVRVLNELSDDIFEITVVSADKDGDYESQLKPTIVLKKVGSRFIYNLSSSLGRLTTYFGLKKLIVNLNPDIILSIQDLQNCIALNIIKKLSIKPKLILVVQNSVQDAYSNKRNIVHSTILTYISERYQEADKIIALSEGVKGGLLELNQELEAKVDVIYNAGLDDVMLSQLNGLKREVKNQTPTLISCGRLTNQKGYPFLFQALQLVKKEGIDFSLQILGRGELEEELKNQVKELDLDKEVSFLGFQNNPYQYIANADIFVLSSIYEGFGNVIVEAMACGTPVISTDCPHGPAEILNDGEFGVLIKSKDIEALSKAIMMLIKDDVLRDTFAQKGLFRANDFHATVIGKKYQEKILELLN